MESFKLSIDWGKTLLTDQNNDETRSFCDLKLICSDGYILIHNAILPDLFRSQQNTSVIFPKKIGSIKFTQQNTILFCF